MQSTLIVRRDIIRTLYIEFLLSGITLKFTEYLQEKFPYIIHIDLDDDWVFTFTEEMYISLFILEIDISK